MLHIKKVSASHQAKPHPYMRRIYQHLESLETQDFGRSDGILVQSFRRPHHASQGWIWFNISGLNPSMLAAELVLYRKTLHSRPLSVTVTLHSIIASQDNLIETPALQERQLRLDQRPSSGYDVFDASAVLALKPVEVVGFQLRYTDESGSLVLHEALTQNLYSLNRGSLQEPLLVLYEARPESQSLQFQKKFKFLLSGNLPCICDQDISLLVSHWTDSETIQVFSRIRKFLMDIDSSVWKQKNEERFINQIDPTDWRLSDSNCQLTIRRIFEVKSH
uniref:TGF-beta propeptide domain-containing protein n=1 Tax=Fundulus heteroclitus TaxID=8078 RepID=A0A3Q2NSM3_FUNHE